MTAAAAIAALRAALDAYQAQIVVGHDIGDSECALAVACREGVPALLARVAALEAALGEIADEVEDREDITDNNCPNWEMRVGNIVRAALGHDREGG